VRLDDAVITQPAPILHLPHLITFLSLSLSLHRERAGFFGNWMQRRREFSFPGSPARGQLPPRPPAGSATAARYAEEEEEVRWLQASRQASPDYSSGTPSPQLWAYHHNPDRQQQQHRLYPASAGSSPSRAQAIAGYRREMLDLVRGLPESAYELSLRDIVEHPATASSPSSSSPPPTHPDPLPKPSNAAARELHTDTAAAATQGSDESAAVAAAAVEDGKKQSKKQGRKQRTFRKQRSRSMERSVSLDTGLLIKLFLPLSVGGKKKKVSPRPEAKDGKKKKQGKMKKEAAPAPAPAQEEWWSKGEFSEAGSSSRTSSTGSSNSSAASIRNGHVNGSSVNPRAPARSWSR
jgi:hypothetical protein